MRLQSRSVVAAAARFTLENLEGRRLLSAGQLDPTFGSGGKVIDFSLPAVTATAVQSDGKVVEGGSILSNFSLARFNADGSPDTTFGFMGRLITDVGGTDVLGKIVIQPDNKIVVVGTTNNNLVAVRYNPDGQLDNTFGTGGISSLSVGLPEATVAVSYIPGGKILVLGQSGQPNTGAVVGSDELIRLNADGSLDTSFGSGGKIENDHPAIPKGLQFAAAQADGQIVVAGSTGDSMEHSNFAYRYGTDGARNVTFASNLGTGTDVLRGAINVGPDGKVVAVEGDGTHMFIIRYNSDGSYDPTFGSGGIVTVTGTNPGGTSPFNSIVEQADGKVVADGDGFIHRYNSNGTVDLTFGVNGKVGGTGALYAGPNGTTLATIQNTDHLEIDRYTGDAAGPGPGSGETPYLGSPAAIPGRIEAENFDSGGEGVGYHTTNPQNFSGNLYRTSGVTVENAGGGGFNVGFLHAGEYLNYTVNVASSGTYDFSARLADAGPGALFHVEVDGVNVTGGLAVPDTGGYQNYQLITRSGVTLNAGQHVVRIVFDANNANGFAGNFDYLQFSSPGGPNAGTGVISGTVFNDTNLDGIKQAGEAPIAGRQVYLDIPGIGHFVAGDPVSTTDANGQYSFSGLAPTNYLVRVVQQAGTVVDSPVYGGDYFIQLGVNPSSTGKDFGILAPNVFTTEEDHKLLVGSTVQDPNNPTHHTLLTRFNLDGTVDTTFGTAGTVEIPSSDNFESAFQAITIRPDGNIIAIVSAFYGDDFTLVDLGGHLVLHNYQPANDAHADAFVTQFNSSLIVAGNQQLSGDEKVVFRLNSAMQLDTNFGGTGVVDLPGLNAYTTTGITILNNGNYQITYANGALTTTRTITPAGAVL